MPANRKQNAKSVCPRKHPKLQLAASSQGSLSELSEMAASTGSEVAASSNLLPGICDSDEFA